MDKHTPGPWWSPDGRTVKQDYRPLTEIGGCIITGVLGGSTSGPLFIESDEEVSANARLIAAAPELLDALESILDAIRKPPTSTGGYHEFDIHKAEIAIAKARGEQ